MIRLNRQLQLAVIAMMAGCSSRGLVSSAVSKATGTPNLSEYGQMGNVSFVDQKSLEEGTYVLTHAETYAFDQSKDHLLGGKLCAQGFDIRMASLRNPGGMLIIVDSRHRKPLAQSDILEISKVVTDAGAKFYGTKIPYRYGPDRKTPIAMSSVVTYEPGSAAKIIPMTATINFSSSQHANGIRDYVDPNTYHVKVHGTSAVVTFKAQEGSAADEALLFQFIAGRLGGKFESIGTSE